MLHKHFLNDAFILHDETFKMERTNEFIYFNWQLNPLFLILNYYYFYLRNFV